MKNNTKNAKLIFYPSGIISLILIPLIGIWYINRHNGFTEYGAMEINWWSPDAYKFVPTITPRFNFPTVLYKEVVLTGDNAKDKLLIEDAQTIIHNIIMTGDTLAGVHFHFSKNAKYWTLVKVFEILEIERARIYVPYENDIWFSYRYKLDEDTRAYSQDHIRNSNSNRTIYESTFNDNANIDEFFNLFNTTKLFYLLTIIYVLMIYFAIKKLYKTFS